ncbi:MAG: ATP-binding protein [Pseudomonadota bacterium]
MSNGLSGRGRHGSIVAAVSLLPTTAQSQDGGASAVLNVLSNSLVAWTIVLCFLLVFVFLSYRSRLKADVPQGETTANLRRLHGILDATHSGILGLNPDAQIVFANASARRLFGFGNDGFPSFWLDHVDFLDEHSFQRLSDYQNPVLRACAGDIVLREIVLMKRRGVLNRFLLRVSSSFLSDTSAGDAIVVLVFDDVTHQEQARQRVERSSRLDALGQLTGGIAHDINNLLAAIKYSIQLSEASTAPEKTHEYNAQALQSVLRSAELTHRLMAFAKREPWLASSQRVTTFLAEFEKLIRASIDDTIVLDVSADAEDLIVFTDVAQLQTALLNLVLNAYDAIKRSGEGNHIVLRACRMSDVELAETLERSSSETYIAPAVFAEYQSDQRRHDGKSYRFVEFLVSDNGPGMDAETKQNAITPFFTTKEGLSGTGLGLSVVYGFAQQAKGIFQILSAPGDGTTARVCVPRGSQLGLREAQMARRAVATGAGHTVLSVEDDAEWPGSMSETIASLGYIVLKASNGKDAVDILKSDAAVDLLITDLVMPGDVGGVALAELARDYRPSLPVIYMTGYTDVFQGVSGQPKIHTIQKPCSPSKLADALVSVLSPSYCATSTGKITENGLSESQSQRFRNPQW